MQDISPSFMKRLGSRILSEANDLKRTPQALAKELDIPFEEIEKIIAGTSDLKTVRNLMQTMASSYPISLGDLWMEQDDTSEGVLVMRAVQSEATSRVFDRVNAQGAKTPYYEYRDTAMSRIAPYKPEWILELRSVSDSDPENPDVAYNNGHLMHQMTFFIGEVNFYWETEGKKYCREMNTGDCNYITPFVPHSFTSRNPSEPGLILAITFGGQVRNALDAFGHIGIDAANEIAGDLRSHEKSYKARFQRYFDAESLTAEQLTERLINDGLGHNRAADLTAGAVPSTDEQIVLARALNVRTSDLQVNFIEPGKDVVIEHIKDVSPRHYPSNDKTDYKIFDLVRAPHMPYLKGFKMTVVGEEAPETSMRHSLHQYVYNYGQEPVTLHWADGRSEVLNFGDSAYIRPMTSHAFSRPAGAGEGHLIIARVPGELSDSVMEEFASFDLDRRHRAAQETSTWF